MNKNELKNGYFNKIAEIKINTQDYKHGIPLTILIKKLHRIGNILSNSIPQNTNQLSFGFENPSLSFVKNKDVDAIENAVLVESINQGSIHLVLESDETDSTKFTEEVNLAKATLTNVISESTKIAEVLSRKTVSASQLQEILNKSKYPDQTRRMLGVMSGPDESVIIDGEVMKVGGYKLPDFCSDGEVVTYKNCEILNFNSKGEIVFDVSQSEGFSLTPNKALLNIPIEIKTESVEFLLLGSALASKMLVDIEVAFSKHTVKNTNKYWLVQILNRNQLSLAASNKILEISRSLNVVT